MLQIITLTGALSSRRPASAADIIAVMLYCPVMENLFYDNFMNLINAFIPAKALWWE